MAQPKTQVNGASVAAFLNAIDDDRLRADARAVARIMQSATRAKPRMWGSSIVGFGTYRQVYANGKTGEWMLVAFAPRKQKVTLYLGGLEENRELLSQLGSHSCGKGCLHIKRLSDIHLPALKKLVQISVKRRRDSERAAGKGR